MKDKEKQIEEMAKLIHIATDLYYMDCIKVATYLFEKDNCRIIDKDDVVISKEEYEKITKELVSEQRAKEIAQEYFGIVRKETAEKILKDIMFCIDINDCNKNEMLILNLCKMLAKQFGVEIKE